MSESYVPRIVDAAVRDYLEAFPAVCIEGPKWCGKTTTASQHAASQFSLADPSGTSVTGVSRSLIPRLRWKVRSRG